MCQEGTKQKGPEQTVKYEQRIQSLGNIFVPAAAEIRHVKDQYCVPPQEEPLSKPHVPQVT